MTNPLNLTFRFREGTPPICWGRPDSPRRELCAICHGALDEVPVMMWKDDGSGASFCDQCVDLWIEVVQR